MPADTPGANRMEAALFGAKTFLVDGLITDCAAVIAAGHDAMGWFDCSTLKEPYRLEGKKTMGLELAEQLSWRLPDVILYPTGGGTGLVGMWKAFDELEALGWLESAKRPRMIACQSDGCAPIVRAFERGERHAGTFANAATIASGLRVPRAVGDAMILDAVRASRGRAIAVDEARIAEATRRACALEGISVCPETGACVLALEQLVRAGEIVKGERVVVFNTGAAQKYEEALRVELPVIEPRGPIDWSTL
jgi:threonine synthase